MKERHAGDQAKGTMWNVNQKAWQAVRTFNYGVNYRLPTTTPMGDRNKKGVIIRLL